MYPPPGPQPHAPQRTTSKKQLVIGCGAATAVAFLMLVSCGVGAAIGTDPNASPTKPTVTKTVTVRATVTAQAAAPATTAPAPAANKPTKVALPNVVGKNGAIAEETLKAKGITNIEWASGDPTAQVVLLRQNWKVIKQEPKAGTKVSPGQTIVLTAVKAR